MIDSAGQDENAEAAARRSQPLRGLRRVRVCLPAAGAAGGLRHQHWRKPLAQQPDSAEQKLEGAAINMKHSNSFLVGALATLPCWHCWRFGMQEEECRSISRRRARLRVGKNRAKRAPLSPRTCGNTSMATPSSSFRPAWFPLPLPTTSTRGSSKPWSMCTPWADPDGAQTILGTGQTKDAQTVQLGDEGVQYAQSVSFRKGRYLVRIVAYESSASTPQALMALAHGVEANL